MSIKTVDVVPTDLLGSDFGELLEEIEAEAQATGPDAAAQNEFFKERARLAGIMLQARLQAGLSQKTLAEKSGLDQAQISKIENQRANLTYDRLARVARALGYQVTLSPITGAPPAMPARRRRARRAVSA